MDSTTNPVAPTEGATPAQQGKAYLAQAQQMISQPAVRRALPAIILVVVAVMGRGGCLRARRVTSSHVEGPRRVPRVLVA